MMRIREWLKKLRVALAVARVRSWRRQIDENERCRNALILQLEYLIRREREASIARMKAEQPELWTRAARTWTGDGYTSRGRELTDNLARDVREWRAR